MAEKKESKLASLRVKKLEVDLSSLLGELSKAQAAHEAAEKETNDLALHYSLQESYVHQKALVEGARSFLDHLFYLWTESRIFTLSVG